MIRQKNSQPLYDVVIVGSGPAGSSAALKLASHGARVAVIEKEKLPRYKVCGGGITWRARQLLDVDIRDAVDLECKQVNLNFLNSNLSFSSSAEVPVISMVMREKLDALLMQYAVDAGAELHANTTFQTISHKPGQLEIKTDKGVLHTRFIIGADGAKSPVAKCMGLKETRYLIPAIESEVYIDQAELDQFSASTRFDFDIIPNGYAWVFPKSGHLSIGLCCAQRGQSRLNKAYAEYLQLLNISSIMREETHGYVIPVSPRTDGFCRDRTLLVGDAAGFADPVTAEGISFAVYSGQLAAQALIDADFDEKNVFLQYEKQIAQNLLPEIKAAKWLAKLLFSPPKFRNWLFKIQGDRMTRSIQKVFMGEDSYQQVMHRHLPVPRLSGFHSEKPGFVIGKAGNAEA